MSEYDAELRELMGKIKADAAEAARGAVRDYLGTIVRGNKILYPSLPYAKAGATAKLGHIGAVQPDGTSVTIDPATGIIHAGLTIPTAKGQILRANVDGNGKLYWELYGLDQGSQNDTLTNDRANSGLPIWHTISAAGSIPSVSGGGSNTAYTVVRDLGVSGTPPFGWQMVGFPEDGWVQAVAVPGDGRPMITGATWVGYSDTDEPGLDIMLVRCDFSIPTGAINSATLTVAADNYVLGAYVNARLVWATPATGTGYAGPQSIAIAPNVLNQGGGITSNCMAFEIQNAAGIPAPNRIGVTFNLVIT